MVERAKEKSEIAVIPSKYKDTFINLINNSDIKFLDYLESPNWLESLNWLKSIDKKICNTVRFRGGLSILLKKDHKNILVTSFELMSKVSDL